ncbi:DedA family protein [Neobacillus notoginsengisoli]|uniref:DedA family protein n=1 Tax=Neobacillus notoginsengisoli TaxID=1578198 RepID=A0A417YYD5_9BACI|nr:DedA family protein [Neobacillus notoginsengisoli]RHW42623.1 DedA family protein [Neobacillus notoginsengisoli]
MEFDFLLDILKNGEYAGLFLWILIGSTTLPLPNEIIMMTIGMAASKTPSNVVPIFFTTLAGVLVAVSTSYFLGRLIGRPLLVFFAKKKRFSKKITSSLRLMDKYHAFSLSISYFVPGVRAIIPFLYGFSKLSFRKFILFAYSGATLWLFIMFSAGYLFGEHISPNFSGELSLITILFIVFLFAIFKFFRKNKIREASEDDHFVPTKLSAIQKGSPD